MRSTRRATALHRTALALLGLGLLGLAVVAALPLVTSGNGTDTAGLLEGVADRGWWPFAAAGAGVLLAVLALLWLRSQLPGTTTSRLGLPGSTAEDRLSIEPAAALKAANAVLGANPDVRSSRLQLGLGRGGVEVRGAVTVHAEAPLDRVTDDVLTTVGHLALALELPALASRVRVAVRR